MESKLVTLLRKVLIDKTFDLKTDRRLYSEFTVLKVKKKTVIIKENDKLDYLYLLYIALPIRQLKFQINTYFLSYLFSRFMIIAINLLFRH